MVKVHAVPRQEARIAVPAPSERHAVPPSKELIPAVVPPGERLLYDGSEGPKLLSTQLRNASAKLKPSTDSPASNLSNDRHARDVLTGLRRDQHHLARAQSGRCYYQTRDMRGRQRCPNSMTEAAPSGVEPQSALVENDERDAQRERCSAKRHDVSGNASRCGGRCRARRRGFVVLGAR